MKQKSGFTLIEVLVVIGIIAILAAIVIIAINPARQFAQARDTQRRSDVNAILNAISQNIADNRGLFTCASAIPNAPGKIIKNPIGTDGVNLYSCLVPNYLSEMPIDPSTGSLTDSSTYNTMYEVGKDPASGRITASSTSEVDGSAISVTR